jgi:hypothetical protein
LVRREPRLTERLYNDLVARQAGALVNRDEWQAFLTSDNGSGPLATPFVVVSGGGGI